MAVATALAVQGGFTVAAAVIAGRNRARAGLSILCAIGALASPLLLPPNPLLRFLAAMAALAVLFRAVDLARDSRDWTLAYRLWLFIAAVDVRRIKRIERRFETTRFLKFFGYLGLAALGYWIAYHLAPTAGPVGAWPVRWLGGAVLIYGIADAGNHGVTALYAVGGMRIPLQHDAPVRALSVGAFWSQHYNLNVSDWLSRNVLRPLARRRRAGIGLGVAFFVSALLHMWLAWVPLDLPLALSMGAFFLVQGGLIGIERAIGQRHWPAVLRRIWTLSWMLVTCPLFVEPFLCIVEG